MSEEREIEMEQNLNSLVAMVEELYERVHRVEKVLIDEGTIDNPEPVYDEHGPDGLFEAAKTLVQKEGRCSISMLQKHFKIDFKRTFGLMDTLEEAKVIAPYRNAPERVVNQ